MKTQARLGILDIWLKSEFSDSALDQIKKQVRDHLTVLDEYRYQYTPIGETIVLILSESHCVLHIYPEHRYLSIDLYVCNAEFDLEGFMGKLVATLDVKKSRKKVLDRG